MATREKTFLKAFALLLSDSPESEEQLKQLVGSPATFQFVEGALISIDGLFGRFFAFSIYSALFEL